MHSFPQQCKQCAQISRLSRKNVQSVIEVRMRNVFLAHNLISQPISTFKFLNNDTTYEAKSIRICVFIYNSHLPFTTWDEFLAIKKNAEDLFIYV